MKTYRHLAILMCLAAVGAGCRGVGPRLAGVGGPDASATDALPGGRLQALVEQARC